MLMFEYLISVFISFFISFSNNILVDIPTFVEFLRVFDSLEEIESYVIDSFGDNSLVKDFANQFYYKKKQQQQRTSLYQQMVLTEFGHNLFQSIFKKN